MPRTARIVDIDSVYVGLGKTQKERQEKYKRWILEGILEKELKFIRSASQRSGIIGGKKFIVKIANMVGGDINLRERGRPRKSL